MLIILSFVVNYARALYRPLPRPLTAAHIIRSDEEALAIAEQLAFDFAVHAAKRDREGLLPIKELDAFSTEWTVGDNGTESLWRG